MKWQWILHARELLKKEVSVEAISGGGGLSWALVYPNTYHVGMSNLGFLSIYRLLRHNHGIRCERAFFPLPAYSGYIMEHSDLRTIETQTPLHDFDIVAFSISYELDFPNVIRLIKMSGLPVLSRERDEQHPLIVAGGAITYLNPEPLADFIDLFVLGEGEHVIPRMLEVMKEKRNESREALLRELSCIKGIYVPCYQYPLQQDTLNREEDKTPGPERIINSNSTAYFHSPIVTAETEFKSTVLMEIMRGCPYKCTFCVVGNSFGDYRVRSFSDIRETILDFPASINRIGLIGASVNCHPEIQRIMMLLREKGMFITFSSMRVDRLEERFLDVIDDQGNRTLTIAPESGSEEMRMKLKKNISDDDIYRSLSLAFKHGITILRLYFMTGLPDECDHDIKAIVSMVKRIRELIMKAGSPCRVSLSINQFIPKAGTPLERVEVAPLQLVTERMGQLERDLPRDVKAHFESPGWSRIQALLARGDRALSAVLCRAETLSSYRAWSKCLKKCEINEERYLNQIGDSIKMPWEHIKNSAGRQIS